MDFKTIERDLHEHGKAQPQIVVPKAMLTKVLSDACVVSSCSGLAQLLTEPVAAEILRRGLAWLAENPIVPCGDDIDSIVSQWSTETGDLKTYERAGIDIAVEWQRRMFLAPEPRSTRDRVLDVLFEHSIHDPHKAADKILALLEDSTLSVAEDRHE
jgi:hypothetical protein